MALSIGIVCLPNVGKSTLFNALTKKGVDAANYPFCTIEPNVGIVKVPDHRLQQLAEISKAAKIINATVEFIDIAGLVRGASTGEGLGNKFLTHIRECDAICEVVRDFVNKDIIHVDGRIDPKSDEETIGMELIFSDIATIDKRLEKLNREVRSGDKEAAKQKVLFDRIKIALDAGTPARSLEYNEEELVLLKTLN